MDVQVVGGRYKISKQLARGGFGNTFLAFDTHKPGNPKCLVKHLKPIVNDPHVLKQAKRLFNQEATILETLGVHDQIPKFFDHFEENQEFYLVQDYIEGHDLTEELPSVCDVLSELEVIILLQEILEVLTFVHQKNVIHRDIKPSNIRRRIDGKIVLIDFGAVKQITTPFINTQGETVFTIPIGTPGYMPSEQANGQPQFSSDIYATGIIGIQALTGIVPGRYGNKFPIDLVTGEIIWRHQAKVSVQLADIIDTMVRYDFRQRYQTAELALQALKNITVNTIVQTNQIENKGTILTKQAPVQNPIQNRIKKFIQNPKSRIKLLSGIAVIIIASLICFTSLNIKPKTEKVLPYINSNYEFQIDYPVNWARQDIEDAVTDQVVTFVSQQQNASDDFQEKVTIRVEAYSGTLQESMNDFVQRALNSKAIVVSKSDTNTLANRKGNKLIFTRNEDSGSFKYLQVWTLKNDKLYVITYTAEISHYDTFIDTAERMIASFKLN